MIDEDDQFELDVPIFIEVKLSSFAVNDLGVFCTLPLNSDEHLGHFKGKTRKTMSQCGDPNYVWTILSSRQVPLFCIDASDPKDSNWLRFIRSTSDVSKYNTICMQQNQQINYFTYKAVKSGDELLTYLPGKKKKNRNKNFQNRCYKLADTTTTPTLVDKKENTNEAIEKRTDESSTNPSDQLQTLNLKNNTSLVQKTTITKDLILTPSTPSINIIFKDKIENYNSFNNRNDLFKLGHIDLILNDATYKRNIYKCVLCPFVVIQSADTEEKESLLFDEHFFTNHLIYTKDRNSPPRTDTEVLDHLMDNMLDKVEQYTQTGLLNFQFKCHICEAKLMISYANTLSSKSDLDDHFKSEHTDLPNLLENMKCLFCDDMFAMRNLDLKNYFDHLKTAHSQRIIETHLVWPPKKNEWISPIYPFHHIKFDLLLKQEENTIKITKTTTNNEVKMINNDDNDYDKEILNRRNNEDSKEMHLEGINNNRDVEDDNEIVKSLSMPPTSLTNQSENKNSEESNDKHEVENKLQDSEENTSELVKVVQSLKVGSITQSQSIERYFQLKKNEEQQQEQKRKQETPSPTPSVNAPVNTKTYTCQMCKKQFDQRLDLSKHQCIELNLKLLKKEKDKRKKKWREAHWKRKIDLSYIETTSLTFLSQNIADNLSFCIDGTSEDLKSYSREVKDYLNTELGAETQTQMVLKSLNLYEKNVPRQLLHSQTMKVHAAIDTSIQKKADSYFVNSLYSESSCQKSLLAAAATSSHTNNKTTLSRSAPLSLTPTPSPTPTIYECAKCYLTECSFSGLVHHQRKIHSTDLKTNYDFYHKIQNLRTIPESSRNEEVHNILSSDIYSTSSIGYLSSDPFAYIVNTYWDQKLSKKCENCGAILNRTKYQKHILSCNNLSNHDNDDDSSSSVNNPNPPTTTSTTNDEDHNSQKIQIKTKKMDVVNVKTEPILQNENTEDYGIQIKEICEDLMKFMLSDIENNTLTPTTTTTTTTNNCTPSIINEDVLLTKEKIKEEQREVRINVKRQRTTEELIQDPSDILPVVNVNKKRSIGKDHLPSTTTTQLHDHHLRKSNNQINSHSSKLSTDSPQKNLVQISQNSSSESDTTQKQVGGSSGSSINLRVSSRIRQKVEKTVTTPTTSSQPSPARSLGGSSPLKCNTNSDITDSSTLIAELIRKSKLQSHSAALLEVRTGLDNRKIFGCFRCGLEFTSANSVFRHQEKSCLRVRVINLGESTKSQSSHSSQSSLDKEKVELEVTNKKKCPICSCVFYSTHRVSIHIYKHHRNLLGSALKPPSSEAKRLHDIQLKKVNSTLNNESERQEGVTENEEEEIEDNEDILIEIETDEMDENPEDMKDTERIHSQKSEKTQHNPDPSHLLHSKLNSTF